MLSVSKYPQNYVDECRARVERQLRAYRKLAGAARKAEDPKVGAALESFEPEFFDNMVLVLDSYFTHRTRGTEGKDGNPLNEVRVLCTSILENGGVLRAEKSIKLKPETSVLGLKVGDSIALNERDFAALSSAFFEEIERRFV